MCRHVKLVDVIVIHTCISTKQHSIPAGYWFILTGVWHPLRKQCVVSSYHWKSFIVHIEMFISMKWLLNTTVAVNYCCWKFSQLLKKIMASTVYAAIYWCCNVQSETDIWTNLHYGKTNSMSLLSLVHNYNAGAVSVTSIIWSQEKQV